MLFHLFLQVKAGGAIPAGFSFLTTIDERIVYGQGFFG
jgi:hypothetical protein